MRVSDVMRRSVISLPQNGTINDVMRKFLQYHIDCLPIVDAAERVVGMITMNQLVDLFLPRYFDILRDYAVLEDKGQLGSLFGASFHGVDHHENLILAADMMSTRYQWVLNDDPLLKAAAVLQAQKAQRLAVVDRDQKLVGLISDFDIILALLSGQASRVQAVPNR